TTADSTSTERNACPRVPPTSRSSAISRVRWASTMVNVLAMTKAATSTDTSAKVSRKVPNAPVSRTASFSARSRRSRLLSTSARHPAGGVVDALQGRVAGSRGDNTEAGSRPTAAAGQPTRRGRRALGRPEARQFADRIEVAGFELLAALDVDGDRGVAVEPPG